MLNLIVNTPNFRLPPHTQVREVALEAIERARRGDGPTLIEAETYRFRGHSLADPDELRSKEEKAKYQVGAQGGDVVVIVVVVVVVGAQGGVIVVMVGTEVCVGNAHGVFVEQVLASPERLLGVGMRGQRKVTATDVFLLLSLSLAPRPCTVTVGAPPVLLLTSPPHTTRRVTPSPS